MADRLRAFFQARIGERYTAGHFLLFVVSLLLLTLAYQRIHIAGNLSAGVPGEPGISTHGHQIVFPSLLALMGLTKSGFWVLYPSLLLAVLPLFWLHLARNCRVPLTICSLLGWSVYFSPMATHLGIYANADVVTNLLALSVVLLVRERPDARVLAGALFFLLMLTHQRSLVLLPGFIAWHLHCEGRNDLKSIARAAAPYLAAALLFFVYKSGYYHVFPPSEQDKPLEFVEQYRRMFRLPGVIDPMVGGMFDYVLSIDNLTWNGLFYFSFLLLGVGAWRSGRLWLAAAAVLIYVGTVLQLLVAEDAHRLTGFLFVVTVMLAIEAQRPGWALPKTTAWYFPLAFASVVAINPQMGLAFWLRGLRRFLDG